jgi:uncharacterized pyridoxal phosphate-containing UPF0001 family protein
MIDSMDYAILRALGESMVEDIERCAKELPLTAEAVIAKVAKGMHEKVEEQRAQKALLDIRYRRLREKDTGEQPELTALMDRVERANVLKMKGLAAMEEAAIVLQELAVNQTLEPRADVIPVPPTDDSQRS